MLLRLLEDIAPFGERHPICEDWGSGVSAMLAALRTVGLPSPVFDNRVASFRVTFFNGRDHCQISQTSELISQ